MRKIILGLAVSLDGLIEGPNGEYDWCFTDQDYGMQEFLQRIDTIFTGRKTYEMSLGKEDFDLGFPRMKEYIFSTTMKTAPEGKTLIKGDIENEVLKIKNSPGKDIWLFGGALLTTSLMNLKLVDEVWLSIHPIILGRGKPIFNDIRERIHLTLTDTKTYSSGLVSVTYQVNGK